VAEADLDRPKAYGGMVIEAGGRAAENIASTPPA